MPKLLKFELFPTHTLHLFLFREVKNGAELLSKLLAFELELALMNTDMIYDEFQVLIAANKSLHSLEAKDMTTKNVHSELVFNIAASKHITASLKKFGITNKSESILVAIFDATEEKLQGITNLVQGREVEPTRLNEDLKRTFNEQMATKSYSLTAEEVQAKGILNAIVNHISVRDS